MADKIRCDAILIKLNRFEAKEEEDRKALEEKETANKQQALIDKALSSFKSELIELERVKAEERGNKKYCCIM